ncbi:hypothetical protein IV203_030800 [Nitzschia inconspicua]|uniref:Uncharacterized protein n=1 Tax=Nitzschia inconspicua TaxID=303405 RepID=A0A9K3LTT4_9STRA|nr:hypothetical protein IV203_030800 [Nitzschia inconspicua]
MDVSSDTAGNCMVEPLAKLPQDVISSSKVHLSPRSPLECVFQSSKNEEMGVASVSSETVNSRKTVTFSPLLPPNGSTPECMSIVETPHTTFSTTSQQSQLASDDLQALATEHGQRFLATRGSSLSKPRIQWAKRVKVKEIRHLNEIPESERDALWISLADQQMNKTMVRTTITMMMRGETIIDDDPDFCTRGLEFRTKAGSKTRSRYKLRVRSAVLNEQDLQREEGITDPDFIAMASMDESVECREAARRRGEQDAKGVEKYLEEARLEFPDVLCRTPTPRKGDHGITENAFQMSRDKQLR